MLISLTYCSSTQNKQQLPLFFVHTQSSRETGGVETSHSTDRTLMDLGNSHNLESVRYYRSEATGAFELLPQTVFASRFSPRRT